MLFLRRNFEFQPIRKNNCLCSEFPTEANFIYTVADQVSNISVKFGTNWSDDNGEKYQNVKNCGTQMTMMMWWTDINEHTLSGLLTDIDEHTSPGLLTDIDEYTSSGLLTDIDEHTSPGLLTDIDEYTSHGLLDGNWWIYLTWTFGGILMNVPHLDFWTDIDEHTSPGLLDENRWTYITLIFGRKIINIPHLDFWTEVDDNTFSPGEQIK